MEIKEQVESIAGDLSSGNYDFDPDYSDYDEPCAADYIGDCLDIEYIIGSNREYLGARILVAFGGPNIWINTRTNTVEGYWWSNEHHAPFRDKLGIDDYIEELWHCQ